MREDDLTQSFNLNNRIDVSTNNELLDLDGETNEPSSSGCTGKMQNGFTAAVATIETSSHGGNNDGDSSDFPTVVRQRLLAKETQDDLANHNDQTTHNHNHCNNGSIDGHGSHDGTGQGDQPHSKYQENGYSGNNLDFLDDLDEKESNKQKIGGLLKLEDMPCHLQFNKYVHTGYREVQNVYGCIKSLFYFHNETVNIITHAIPIVYIIWYYSQMWPWEDTEHNIYFTLLGWSHILGSIFPWLGSVVYHVFMNHHLGANLYKFLLQVDMFGIWMAQCVGALTNLTASTWCLPQIFQTSWMILYGLASAWGLYKALTAWSPLARRMCFTGVVISRVLGFFVRISAWGGGDPNILAHVILQDAISIIGGMIGVVRIPEKWFPGKLDMFCNSHHIMHVFVVWAVFHMNQASNGDIRWILNNYSRSQCAPLF